MQNKQPSRAGTTPGPFEFENMKTRLALSPHLTAILQALLVTFLWSTSWVLIKFGLKDIPAITFAGLRYTLAFMALLPFALRRAEVDKLRRLPRGLWLRLILLGVLYYAVTQAAQFLGLQYLPAITNTLLLSFSSVLVAGLGIVFLSEQPTRVQWLGGGLYLAGVGLYFYPLNMPAGQAVGFLIVGIGVLANAFSSVLGRSVNRGRILEPATVTIVTMGIGAALLLLSGLVFQGLPRLSWQNWIIIAWLAVVNSAFAFTLWNHTLRTLSAVESSIINNTMLFQIALLAWAFLGERPGALAIAGMLVAAVGTLLVQRK